MADNSDTRGTDQPKHSRERRGEQPKRDGDDGKRGVELRGGCAPGANLEIVAFELADAVHANDDEDDNKEQQQVGEQAVDAEHSKDRSIVAGEVAQVVVDAALRLTEVGRLRDALEVEELADRAQIGKARRDGGGAQAVEASLEVHPGGQGGDGDVEARHGGCERVARLRGAGLRNVGSDEGLLLFNALCGRSHCQRLLRVPGLDDNALGKDRCGL